MKWCSSDGVCGDAWRVRSNAFVCDNGWGVFDQTSSVPTGQASEVHFSTSLHSTPSTKTPLFHSYNCAFPFFFSSSRLCPMTPTPHGTQGAPCVQGFNNCSCFNLVLFHIIHFTVSHAPKPRPRTQAGSTILPVTLTVSPLFLFEVVRRAIWGG